MKQLLTEKGWKMYYSCHCGGTLKEYYSHVNHPFYEVRVRPRKGSFTILNKNQVVAGPHLGYLLSKKMSEHGL